MHHKYTHRSCMQVLHMQMYVCVYPGVGSCMYKYTHIFACSLGYTATTYKCRGMCACSSQIHTHIYIHTTQQLPYPRVGISSQIHTHIYIHTTQQLRYPREVFHHKYTHIFTFILHSNYHTPGRYFITNTHTYLHSYYTATTIPQGGISSQIHTHIYIYTTQQLPYPREVFHHKYTHIFTFILHSNYHTPGRYFITNTHTYLHLYYTATTIPQGGISSQIHTHIYIHTTQQLRYLREVFHHKYTHIFTFILHSNYDTPGRYFITNTHTYLHSYYTATTIPQGGISSQIHTHIYIHTTQQLRYPREVFHHKYTHIFTFILHSNYHTPGEHYNLCLYPWSRLDDTTNSRYFDN